MRKEPKYQSQAYNSYYREGKARNNEYDDHYMYNYDYDNNSDFDSYYQISGGSEWHSSKSHNVDYLNYKLPYKHKDSKANIKEDLASNSYSSKANYNEYNNDFDDSNDYNQYYKHQNSKQNNQNYPQTYKDSSTYNNKSKNYQSKNLGEKMYQAQLYSKSGSSTYSSKNKPKSHNCIDKPQLEQQYDKPSTGNKINNNFGSKNMAVSQEELKKLNVKECFYRGDDRISENNFLKHNSNNERVTHKTSKSNKDGEKSSNIKLSEKACKSKKQNHKELYKINEFDSDVETFDNTESFKRNLMPSRGQETSLYYVNPISMSQHNSHMSNIPVGFTPQYVQFPIGQPNYMHSQNFQSQILDPRIGYSGQNCSIPLRSQAQPFINYMVPSMADPRVAMNQLRIPPASNKIFSNINNYSNIQQTLSSQEQPQIPIIDYPLRESSLINNHMQISTENEKYEMMTNQLAKDTLYKQNLDGYAQYYQNDLETETSTNIQSQMIGLSVPANLLQNCAPLARQLPSKPQIFSLMLGPKVSIRNQFINKGDSTTSKIGKATTTIELVESIQKDCKSEVDIMLRTEEDENSNDQLAFLHSFQSEDHPCMTGIKDLVFSKEVDYENDYKSSLQDNVIQVDSSNQQENKFSKHFNCNQSLASQHASEASDHLQTDLDNLIFDYMNEPCCSNLRVSKVENLNA